MCHFSYFVLYIYTYIYNIYHIIYNILFSNIDLISRQISLLEVVDSALLSRCFLQAPIPSLCGMLEYKAVTSNVAKMVLSCKLSMRLNLFKKSVVSLM